MKSKLKQNKLDFSTIVENSTDMIVRFDTDLRYIYCNAAVEIQLGILVETLIGKTTSERGGPQNQVEFIENSLQVALSTGEVQEVEQSYPTPRGIRYYNTRIIPEKDKNGKIQSLLAISRDITERKRIEEELSDNENLLKQSQIIAGLGSFVMNISTGLWKSSDVLDKLFGIDKTYERSMEAWEGLIHPDDRIMMINHFRNEVLGQGQSFDNEYRIIRHNDKTERWVHGKGRLEFDTQGHSLKIYGTIQDITYRKQSEEALRESETQFRSLFEKASDGIIYISVDKELIQVNESFAKMHGYTIKEMQNMKLQDLDVEDQEKLFSERMQRLENGEDLRFEVKHYHKDGHIICLEVSACIMSLKKGNLYVAFHRDITERKQAEDALKKNEERLQNIIDGTNVGTWEWNIKTGETIFDEKWAAIIGCTLEEIQPVNIETWVRLAHPDDLKKSDEVLQKHFRKEIDYYAFDSRMKHKDGSWIWVYDRGKVIEWDEKGEPVRMFGTHTDMTDRKRSESALKESEEMLHTIFDNSPIALEVYDRQGVLRNCNKKAYEMFGTTPDATIDKFNLRDDPNYQNHDVWERLDRGEEVHHEIVFSFDKVTYSTKKTGITYYYIITTPIPEKVSSKIGYIMQIIDITERKLAEMVLRENDNLLRKAQEITHIGHFKYNPNTGIVEGSDELFRIYGISREVFQFSDFANSVPSELHAFVDSMLQSAIEKGEGYEIEHYIKLPDGSLRFVSAKGESIPAINKSEQPLLIGTVQDITERKSMEDALQKNEKHYQSLVEGVPGIIYSFSEKTGGVYYSLRVTDILGYSPEQLLAQPMLWHNSIHPDDISRVDQRIYDIANTKKFRIEYRIIDANGNWHWFDDRSIEYQTGDTEVIVHGIAIDITERKQAEEKLKESYRILEETLQKLKDTQKQVLLQEKLRSLGQMTSGICHDINNSLSPIMGYTEMLTDDEELMKKHEKKLNNIIKATKNISSTIGRLKEFYKVKLDDNVLTEKDINKIINSTIELTSHKWKNMAQSTGSVIVIKREFQKDLPLTKVDESELIEALTNVILNACDSMIDGGSLTFRTYQKEKNIVIEVHDTGMGMDEETLQHCLDPFYSTKGDLGTGLGLSMVFGVIERHKGEIKIESEPNKGTVVKLVLPVDKTIIKGEIIDEIIKSLRPLKILSVEDDKVISEMLKQMLDKKGNTTELALNGKVGLELYKQAIEKGEPFDLVITDLGMAEMDGISLSKFIKELTPDIPIILFTGFGTMINIDDHQTIDCLLKKPIMMEDLFKGIAGLFNVK